MATDSSADPQPSSEATLIIRALCEKTPKGMRWREKRPRVLAERVGWDKNTAAAAAVEGGQENGGEDRPSGFEGEDLGTFVVEGVVRGNRLSANRLMHVQGWGDFKVSKVRRSLAALVDGKLILRAPARSSWLRLFGNRSAVTPSR